MALAYLFSVFNINVNVIQTLGFYKKQFIYSFNKTIIALNLNQFYHRYRRRIALAWSQLKYSGVSAFSFSILRADFSK